MPTDTYSYTVRIVEYKPTEGAHSRNSAFMHSRESMLSMGWELVYSTHSLDHTASLYRRPAGINSVYLMAQDGEILRTTLD